ncbi:hypothetical protein [Moorena producens]|uniref:hypothetical protein n=1 Tax=Moorena producens TaxID=1155739 RepID=UPI003C750D76
MLYFDPVVRYGAGCFNWLRGGKLEPPLTHPKQRFPIPDSRFPIPDSLLSPRLRIQSIPQSIPNIINTKHC